MNSGSNHPASNGGRGRKRRRGRRGGQGAGAQAAAPAVTPGATQAQSGSAQSNQPPHASRGKQSQERPAAKRQFKPKPPVRNNFAEANGNGNGNGSGTKRVYRSVVNQKTPDAGIYSAPMDHSYRTLQHDGNTGRPGYEAMPVVDHSASKPIFVFVDDLFFMAKIQETARKLNVKVAFVKSDKEVLEAVAAGEEKPSLIIIDLNHHTVKPLTIIPKLKAKFKKDTNIIGFLSHLQGELKMKAHEVGCDMVLPRSAFSQNLPQLLRRHATSETELQEH